MSPFILIPFAIGTAAFFAGLAVTLSQPRGPRGRRRGLPRAEEMGQRYKLAHVGRLGRCHGDAFSRSQRLALHPHGLGLTLSPGVDAR